VPGVPWEHFLGGAYLQDMSTVRQSADAARSIKKTGKVCDWPLEREGDWYGLIDTAESGWKYRER